MCAKLCWCLLLVCMLLYVIRSQDNGHQSYHQNTRGLELGHTVRRRTRPLWALQRVYQTSWWKGNFLFKPGAVSESVTCNYLVTLGGFQLQSNSNIALVNTDSSWPSFPRGDGNHSCNEVAHICMRSEKEHLMMAAWTKQQAMKGNITK